MKFWRVVLVAIWTVPAFAAADAIDPLLSTGRHADPMTKTLSEIRASEHRRVPLEVLLKTSAHYTLGNPVEATIIITNLFDSPLLMNSRMLVNHPLLQGEVSMRIMGPDGKKVEIQRLITPLSVREEDFVLLYRGQSMQRAVDLSDLFGMTMKGAYKIQVTYHNEVDHVSGGIRAWKGIVWSEPVDITLQ